LAILAVIALIIFTPSTSNPTSTSKDEDIASSVVNIYCQGKTDEESSGGSGTILTESGLVLTNAHIILDNDDVARLNNDPNHVIVDDKIWFGEDANNELPIVVEIKRQ
jgi:S1-C subfamily serine protease